MIQTRRFFNRVYISLTILGMTVGCHDESTTGGGPGDGSQAPSAAAADGGEAQPGKEQPPNWGRTEAPGKPAKRKRRSRNAEKERTDDSDVPVSYPKGLAWEQVHRIKAPCSSLRSDPERHRVFGASGEVLYVFGFQDASEFTRFPGEKVRCFDFDPGLNRLYVATMETGSLHPGSVQQCMLRVIDANDGKQLSVTKLKLGMAIRDIAIDSADGRIYALSAIPRGLSGGLWSADRTIGVWDVDGNPVLDSSGISRPLLLPLGLQPVLIEADRESQHVYVAAEVSVSVPAGVLESADKSDELLSKLIVTSGTLPQEGTDPDTLDVPKDVRNSEAGDIFLVTIDSEIGRVIGRLKLGAMSVADLKVNSATHRVYLADEDGNTVYVFNGLSNHLETQIHLPRSPVAVCTSPITDRIYVASNDSSLMAIDGTSNRVLEEKGFWWQGLEFADLEFTDVVVRDDDFPEQPGKQLSSIYVASRSKNAGVSVAREYQVPEAGRWMPELISPSDSAEVSLRSSFEFLATHPEGKSIKYSIMIQQAEKVSCHETDFFRSAAQVSFQLPASDSLRDGEVTWRVQACDKQEVRSLWSAEGSFRATSPEMLLAKRHAPVLIMHSKEHFKPRPVEAVLPAGSVPIGGIDIGKFVGVTRRLDVPGYAAFDRKLDDNPQTQPVVYARVVPATEASPYTVVQYWFFYLYNDFAIDCHEGEWELVELVWERPDGNLDNLAVEHLVKDAITPTHMVFSQHFYREVKPWSDVRVQDTHPEVYVALGSHASYASLDDFGRGFGSNVSAGISDRYEMYKMYLRARGAGIAAEFYDALKSLNESLADVAKTQPLVHVPWLTEARMMLVAIRHPWPNTPSREELMDDLMVGSWIPAPLAERNDAGSTLRPGTDYHVRWLRGDEPWLAYKGRWGGGQQTLIGTEQAEIDILHANQYTVAGLLLGDFAAEAVLILAEVVDLRIQIRQAIIDPPSDFVGFAGDMLLRIERIERQWKLLSEKYPEKWKQLLEEYKERGLGWSVLKGYRSSIIPPGPREQGSKWDAPGRWWRLKWIANIP